MNDQLYELRNALASDTQHMARMPVRTSSYKWVFVAFAAGACTILLGEFLCKQSTPKDEDPLFHPLPH